MLINVLLIRVATVKHASTSH